MRISERLLRRTVQVAPAHLREWGQAMLAEAEYVEGHVARTRWELGATFALVRMTMTGERSKRPRILFSVGVALTLIAVPILAMALRVTWGMTHVYTDADVRVVNVERTDYNYTPPTTVLKFGFETIVNPGEPFKVQVITGDSAERDSLLAKYRVGTAHRIGIKRALKSTFGILPEYRYETTLMPKMLGGSIGFALLALLLMFVGWRRGASRRLQGGPGAHRGEATAEI